MKQQPSKKAMGFSAVLTGLILIGLVGVNLTKQGWSMALTNPLKIEQVQAADLASGTLDALDAQTADPTTAPDVALDPALEAALDAALDPNMDPALKDSLKSALRSALAPQTVSATGKQPPIVVTVEPVYMPGQQQASASGGQQWSAPASAPAQTAAPVQSAPATDQVAAAYQAQLGAGLRRPAGRLYPDRYLAGCPVRRWQYQRQLSRRRRPRRPRRAREPRVPRERARR